MLLTLFKTSAGLFNRTLKVDLKHIEILDVARGNLSTITGRTLYRLAKPTTSKHRNFSITPTISQSIVNASDHMR